MVDGETQTLEEDRSDQNVSMTVMITKNGKAAQCRYDCPFLSKIAFDSVSELVFSLRSKRRFRKAHMEAARWVMKTNCEPQSEVLNCRVFCASSKSHLLNHSCTSVP